MPAASSPAAVRRSPAAIAVVAAAVVVIVCAVLVVGEARYRSCIARAEAEFPAVPVSSFTGDSTGPLKVSFVNERTRALEDCGRFL
jgi:hypothetical protein